MLRPVEPSNRGKALSALLVLIAIAVGARLIWALLEPVLPALIALAIFAVVVTLFLGRRP